MFASRGNAVTDWAGQRHQEKARSVGSKCAVMCKSNGSWLLESGSWHAMHSWGACASLEATFYRRVHDIADKDRHRVRAFLQRTHAHAVLAAESLRTLLFFTLRPPTYLFSPRGSAWNSSVSTMTLLTPCSFAYSDSAPNTVTSGKPQK